MLEVFLWFAIPVLVVGMAGWFVDEYEGGEPDEGEK